jgi:activator of HSP90 ATPase
MIDFESSKPSPRPLGRRQLMLASALGVGGLASSPVEAVGEVNPDGLRTSLHQEVVFKAPSSRLYEILLDSREFSAFSGEAAQIDARPGGAFSLFGGKIVGRTIELAPNARIVQAWRPAYWEPGIYSLVKFELRAEGERTRIVLDHWGFPQGKFAGFDSGWPERYWRPLEKFLG